MQLVFEAAVALSFIAWLCLVAMPIAAVVASRSEQAGRPNKRLTTHNILIVNAFTIIASPALAAVFTPDWSPVTMLGLSGVGWATAAWSAVFIARSKRGTPPLKAAVQATLAGFAAPIVGTCWLASQLFVGLLFS